MASPGQHPRAPGAQAHAVRAGGLNGMVVPILICVLYAGVTWEKPHRPMMIAVAAAMLLSPLLRFGAAAVATRSWPQTALEITDLGLPVTGCTVLAYLDGGVAGP